MRASLGFHSPVLSRNNVSRLVVYVKHVYHHVVELRASANEPSYVCSGWCTLILISLPFTMVLFKKGFTPENCRASTVSGTRTPVELEDSILEGARVRFREYRRRRLGSSRAYFRFRLTLKQRNLILFLSHHKLENLMHRGIDLNTEKSCRVVPATEGQFLELLVELVREGRGFEGIRFGSFLHKRSAR
jgi:hypothetical protein